MTDTPERDANNCERCGTALPFSEFHESTVPAAFVRIVFPTVVVVMAICERCAESYGAWSKRLADVGDRDNAAQRQMRIL